MMKQFFDDYRNMVNDLLLVTEKWKNKSREVFNLT